jgi:3-oxoadipate enol-lactonase
MSHDFLEINGAACRFALSGEGPQTLALIHELAGSLDSWDDFVACLPPTLRVLRYDLRGAGMSEKVSGRLDLDQLADDVAALLDGIAIGGPVVVAGAAIGATVAVRFATRQAARCERLVLIGPALGVPEERKASARELADRIEQEGMRSVAGAVLPKALPKELWADPGAERRAVARWLGADPQGYAAAYRMLIELDLRADLAAIRVPTLALAGRFDPFGTPDIVRSTRSPSRTGASRWSRAGISWPCRARPLWPRSLSPSSASPERYGSASASRVAITRSRRLAASAAPICALIRRR